MLLGCVFLTIDAVVQDMPNIHAVSHSFAQLADLCATGLHRTPAASKPSWLKDLEATGWFEQLGYLLAAAERLVVGMGEKRVSCLVHCSDGWDRTTQLVSLAAMLLDPCVPSFSLLTLCQLAPLGFFAGRESSEVSLGPTA